MFKQKWNAARRDGPGYLKRRRAQRASRPVQRPIARRLIRAVGHRNVQQFLARLHIEFRVRRIGGGDVGHVSLKERDRTVGHVAPRRHEHALHEHERVIEKPLHDGREHNLRLNHVRQQRPELKLEHVGLDAEFPTDLAEDGKRPTRRERVPGKRDVLLARRVAKDRAIGECDRDEFGDVGRLAAAKDAEEGNHACGGSFHSSSFLSFCSSASCGE